MHIKFKLSCIYSWPIVAIVVLLRATIFFFLLNKIFDEWSSFLHKAKVLNPHFKGKIVYIHMSFWVFLYLLQNHENKLSDDVKKCSWLYFSILYENLFLIHKNHTWKGISCILPIIYTDSHEKVLQHTTEYWSTLNSLASLKSGTFMMLYLVMLMIYNGAVWSKDVRQIKDIRKANCLVRSLPLGGASERAKLSFLSMFYNVIRMR